MKKTWFDLRLYVDGLKQLKLMGILFTIVTTAVAVITPIMEQLDYLQYRNDMIGTNSASTVSAFEMNPLLILLFCLFTPLMTLFLFSFLNKREASDFYHAIPATRPCLFFSFFAAVMTWSAVILVISNVLSLITFASLPHLFLVDAKALLLYSFNAFAGAWLIAAAVGIATALSGTVVVNLLIALILIFFPRVILLMLVGAIEDSFPLVQGLNFVPFLSTSYNVPVGFIFNIFTGGDWDLSLTRWQSGAYTLVVALLYTAAAAWLFVRRRSEAAGHSAPSKKLQGLFRFLVGFVITSIATYGIHSLVSDIHYTWDLVDIGSLVLVYGGGIFVMLVFEVFCTRKFRGLIRKGAITVAWLVVANAALLGTMYGLSRTLFLYRPAAKEIQSVRITSSSITAQYDYAYSSNRNYFSAKVSEIELTDDTVKTIVSEQLEHTVGLLEISKRRYDQATADGAEQIVVAIKSGGHTRYRRIYVYKDDMAELTKRLELNEDYRNVYTTLPETVSGLDVNGDKRVWVNFKDSEETNKFYQVLKDEFAALAFETKYRLTSSAVVSDEALATLYVRLSEGGKWYSFELPVYQQLMPKTAKYIVNLANKTTNAADGLKVLAEEAYNLDYFEVQFYKDGKISPMRYFKLPSNPSMQAKVADWLTQLQAANATANIDTSKPFAYVCGQLQREQQDENEHWTYTEQNYAYVAIPELPAWIYEFVAGELDIPVEDVTDDWIFGNGDTIKTLD